MLSMAGWWTDMVEIVRSIPQSVRTGSRFGRIFRLRDHGRLEDALRQALALTHELLAGRHFMDRPNAILAASTVDELAVRLGRPAEAREVLERALEMIEREQAELSERHRSADYQATLEGYSRRFRERLRPDH
jgi:hypothetical protein